MLDLLHRGPLYVTQPHPICLNQAFRSDLMWWRTFVEDWNGISFLPPPNHLPQLQMASDASGSWGCGGWHGPNWFQLQWDTRSADLLSVVMAAFIWGHGAAIVLLALRQPGGGNMLALQNQSGGPHHAHAPCTGICGGQTLICFSCSVY